MIVPAAIAGMLGSALGTVGFVGAAFGMGTVCTDFNTKPHACDSLNRWLEAGLIVQWVLVLGTGALLAIGLKRPPSRRRIAVGAWVMVAITIAWYSFYVYSGYHSYKHFTYDKAVELRPIADFNGHKIRITYGVGGTLSVVPLGSNGKPVRTDYENASGRSQLSLTRTTSTINSFAIRQRVSRFEGRLS